MNSSTYPKLLIWFLMVFSVPLHADPSYQPNLVTQGNLWQASAYRDSDTNHVYLVAQDICFFYIGDVGTHARYLWVSMTYPGWAGVASQEADQIFMYGNFSFNFGKFNFSGHDGMQWEIVTGGDSSLGAGHWKAWLDIGPFGAPLGFTNVKFKRRGSCHFGNADEALNYSQSMQYPAEIDGNPQTNPMGIDTSPFVK